ncbi:hypothetical protein YPPY101_2550, partial [Yersinia pestis PY-101]
MFCGGGA